MNSGFTKSKSKKFFLLFLLLTTALATCKKDSDYFDNAKKAKFNIIRTGGECSGQVHGRYYESRPLHKDHSIDLVVNVIRKGSYNIVTDTANGIQFKATGIVTETGKHTFHLAGQGTPIREEITRIQISSDESVCSFEINVLDYPNFDTINTSEYAWEFYDNGVYHHGHVDSSVGIFLLSDYSYAFSGNESTDSNAVFRLSISTPLRWSGTYTDSLTQSFEYVVDNDTVFSTYRKSSTVTLVQDYGWRIKGGFSWTGLNDEGILHEVKVGKFYVKLDSVYIGPGVQ